MTNALSASPSISRPREVGEQEALPGEALLEERHVLDVAFLIDHPLAQRGVSEGEETFLEPDLGT